LALIKAHFLHKTVSVVFIIITCFTSCTNSGFISRRQTTWWPYV